MPTTIKLFKPLRGDYPITQSYDEHVNRAKELGLCYQPGSGCNGYYYGGIDYGCPVGTKIYAAASGKLVTTSFDSTGYGNYVKIDHDGFTTIYAHLNYIPQLASKITVGEVIGFSGSTGNSTGPHLHFELRIKGIPTDPAPYLYIINDTSQPEVKPVISNNDIKALDTIVLKKGYDYVNIRNGPGLTYDVVGMLLPDDEPKKVYDVDGEWVCILKWKGLSLWVNYYYIEPNT